MHARHATRLSNTTKHKYASPARRLHPPCSTQHCVHERSPYRQDRVAHIDNFGRHTVPGVGDTCSLTTHCPSDVSTCPLVVRRVTACTSKPLFVFRSACGASRSSTMIQSSRITEPTIPGSPGCSPSRRLYHRFCLWPSLCSWNPTSLRPVSVVASNLSRGVPFCRTRNRFSRPLAPATTCLSVSSPSLYHLLTCAKGGVSASTSSGVPISRNDKV